MDSLAAMLRLAIAMGFKCTCCDAPTERLISCRACGWTRRFCESCKVDHGPKMKQLHKAICVPVVAQGSN